MYPNLSRRYVKFQDVPHFKETNIPPTCTGVKGGWRLGSRVSKGSVREIGDWFKDRATVASVKIRSIRALSSVHLQQITLI